MVIKKVDVKHRIFYLIESKRLNKHLPWKHRLSSKAWKIILSSGILFIAIGVSILLYFTIHEGRKDLFIPNHIIKKNKYHGTS